ncbi:uncharacterized protein LOC130014006 [Patella vulgata]|uniref:uncharacterized protein LOC130014006 n=1 Tax=Patella vulgata TaxID=6465 RepID=UPI0024A9F9A1|nr:uncharacterized protein LOC130014006 [Patella vulgata]
MMYIWFKHGIYYDNGSILQDRDVDINDKGDDIICIATDDPHCKTGSTLNTIIGNTRCKDVLGFSDSFILQPEYGPYDLQLIYNDTNLKPDEEIKKRLGEELSVNCMSDCNPACNISWNKDGKILSNNSQLNLPDLQESDNGVYYCGLYNIHGTRYISFILDLHILTDPDCCPPAENSMSSDDVALVDIGERIMVVREITGYPKPSIEMESMILPVGISRHYRYINYTLVNTSKPHHYNLSLSVYVVTKHYIGKYCIYLKNKYGVVHVCHTLMQATNGVINTSTGISIVLSIIEPLLLITAFIIGLVFVKKCFNKMAPNTRTNPLEHHYEQVTMQQFSTDLTTLNVPSNRTHLRDRESVITSSTQRSPEYARPVSLIVHGLPDYDQQENLTDVVEDDGDNEDSGDDSVNDTSSASMCMNSPSSVPNVYEKLNKNTRIAQLNLYKKLKW